MRPGVGRALVFASSAAVLVLEIVAGRLLAPYIGVSLETFTGIIGVVLAGIATGAWAGGLLADSHEPRLLIGPAFVAGGALAWLSLPILTALGPQFGGGSVAIVLLSGSAFFLPAAALSAITPLVAKAILRDLGQTGSIVGGLSAAGTVGALAGTFLTGFVLISAIPTRPIVMIIGACLVVIGAASHWYLNRALPAVAAVLLVVLSGVLGGLSNSRCDFETGYFCAIIVEDPDNPSGRSLILDGLRHAYVDLDDPTNLDIRYIRLFARAADALPPGPLESLHIGGGGFSFPRYLQHVRPGSVSMVLEIDDELVDIVKDELGLVLDASLQVRTGDGRLGIDEFGDDTFDMVVGDAFGGEAVPWHLTTEEFLTEVDRVLAPDGIYVMNIIDGDKSRFARAEVATLQKLFPHVAVIHPTSGIPSTLPVNQVLIASQSPLPTFSFDEGDGRLLSPSELEAFVDGADPLRDDFAPVDQLSFR